MRRSIYRSLSFIFAGIAFHLIANFCEKETDGFTIHRIQGNLPERDEWKTRSPSPNEKEQILDALKQKFYYLGSGGQCYAFASEDGTTVLKFFKFHRLNKKKKKLERDFKSYKLAFDILRDQTGLIFVHLNKSRDELCETIIVDKIGIEHKLQLDGMLFVLQKRAELVYPKIDRLMKNNDVENATKAVEAVVSVIVERCKAGVFDEDARIHRNFGFLNDRAIVIDVGRFIPDPSQKKAEIYKAEVYKITRRFNNWLAENHPTLLPALNNQIQKVSNEE